MIKVLNLRCYFIQIEDDYVRSLESIVECFRKLMESHITQEELDPVTEMFDDFVDLHLDNLTKSCSNSGTITSVHPIKSIGSYELACGTVFTTLSQTHINGCD